MSALSAVGETFGFHTQDTKCLPAKNIKAFNGFNITGYIPGVGLGILVIRILCVANKFGLDPNAIQPKELKALKVSFIVRGVFEGLGLGLLYLIPDIIASIARARTPHAVTVN